MENFVRARTWDNQHTHTTTQRQPKFQCRHEREKPSSLPGAVSISTAQFEVDSDTREAVIMQFAVAK